MSAVWVSIRYQNMHSSSKSCGTSAARQQLLRQQRQLLTSVAVVVRNSQLSKLPVDVTLQIEELVDESVAWTLEWASSAGFVHLLDRLAAQERPDVGPTFRRLR